MVATGNTADSLLEPAFLRKLERLSIVAKRIRAGASKGERRSNRKGSSTDFTDYRDYVQGDDLRHVDWNIYGRLEQLCLKLFEEHQDLTVHILIDASASMGYGSAPKIEFAKRIAAAMGYVALAGYERVSVGVFRGDSVEYLPPCRGKASVRKLFAFLDAIDTDGGTELEANARRYVSRGQGRGVTLIVSDFFDESGHEGCLRRLNQPHSDVYAIHVLAPEEIDPQLTGDLKLIDSETGAHTEISVSRALMKRYLQNRDAFTESVRQYCAKRGLGYVPVASDAAIENLTLGLLRRGGLVS